MIINIIYSILLILGWIAILKYRKIIKGWTGNFYWAEKYIGNWWTYLVLIILGMAMIFYWIRYPFIH